MPRDIVHTYTARESIFDSSAAAFEAQTEDPQDGTERVLTMEYQVRSWTERHPYGDTYASETLTEAVDDSYVYWLDEEDITREELVTRYGEAFVDHLIDKMEQNAERKS